MKVRLRGVVLLLGAAALIGSVVTVFAGTASGAPSAAKLQLAVFYYNPSPYGIAQLKGAQRAAKALGIKISDDLLSLADEVIE